MKSFKFFTKEKFVAFIVGFWWGCFSLFMYFFQLKIDWLNQPPFSYLLKTPVNAGLLTLKVMRPLLTKINSTGIGNVYFFLGFTILGAILLAVFVTAILELIFYFSFRKED